MTVLERGKTVPFTETETENETEIPLTTSTGAAAPSGEGTNGGNAGEVVAEYVRTRTAAGLFTAKPHRAILGKYARSLIASGRWDHTALLVAASEFAATKRHPRFFEEWVREAWTRAELAEHKQIKAEENLPLQPEVLAAMGRLMGRGMR